MSINDKKNNNKKLEKINKNMHLNIPDSSFGVFRLIRKTLKPFLLDEELVDIPTQMLAFLEVLKKDSLRMVGTFGKLVYAGFSKCGNFFILFLRLKKKSEPTQRLLGWIMWPPSCFFLSSVWRGRKEPKSGLYLARQVELVRPCFFSSDIPSAYSC